MANFYLSLAVVTALWFFPERVRFIGQSGEVEGFEWNNAMNAKGLLVFYIFLQYFF